MTADDAKLVPPHSLREKLAQLLVVRIGSNLPPVRTSEEDTDRIAALLERCPLGGLIVFNGRREQTPETLAKLQALSETPLLIGADIERGIGQQLHGPALFPHAAAFEKLANEAEQAVEQFARLTAREALACGLHITFAPVADVNVDPRNPIIATRAFGNDPQRVSQLVTRFVEGCQAEGLLSAAKHFPGHGNTHEDSHHALPTVHASREEIKQCELVPFRAAIAAEVPLVMSAHVRYPALDDSGAPATLSRPILVEVLREELGFRGAVISDSLLMEGVKSQCDTEGELAVRALMAGVDILLDVAEPESTLAALERAVEANDLPLERIDEAFARVWQLKRQVFDRPAPHYDPVWSEEASELVSHVASDSIRCLAGEGRQLPFSSEKKTCAILLRPYQSHLDPPEQPLAPALRQRSSGCDYHELTPRSGPEEYDRARDQAFAAEQVLIAVIVKPAAWHKFGLLPEQAELVRQLLGQQRCVLASLGTPEALAEFDTQVKLCTYSDVPASQVALAEYCFSEPR